MAGPRVVAEGANFSNHPLTARDHHYQAFLDGYNSGNINRRNEKRSTRCKKKHHTYLLMGGERKGKRSSWLKMQREQGRKLRKHAKDKP